VARTSESVAFSVEPPQTESELLGRVLDGRYRVTGRLGGGGMGEVFEVEHVRLARQFALKLLRRELMGEPELIERFDREARAVAALRSDYVVSIVDSGLLDDGRPYFVMERLIGEDLKQLLASSACLPVTRAVNIAIDACLGLRVAHAGGLVHRDLKPENVFVTRTEDGRDRCKLLDFGVVKLAKQDYTRPGALVGTARYMAPEQVAHAGEVGPSADLFALGIILYRCLSGQHPFTADSLERVLFRIMNDVPARLDEACPHVPAGLATLVESLLAKAPADRPASALELAHALRPFAGASRELSDQSTWQLDTTLTGAGAFDRLTPAEITPALAASTPPMPTRVRGGAWLVATSALLSVLGTLGAQRLFFRASAVAGPKTRTEAALTVTYGATPVPPRSSAPPLAAALQSLPAAQAAPTPSLATATPKRSASSQHGGKAGARPVASATSGGMAEQSAHWFDPRNPYGK